MKAVTAVRLLIPMVIVCLLQVDGWGAAGYDACLQEEQRLRAAEADDCSGLSYVFNPSGCFITRKTLVTYDKGKCREIAAREGVVPQKAEPAKPVPVATPVTPATVPPVAVEVPPQPRAPMPAAAKAAASPTEIEQLRAEIAALREELRLLREEVGTLRQK